MIDARRYNVCVKFTEDDGEPLYHGTVRELPDVSVYENTADEAYAAVVEVISDLQASFEAKGKYFPRPDDSEATASGRTTLRMSKSLHYRVTQAALSDDISLNQWLVEAAAWRLNGAQAAATVVAPNAISVNCDVGSGSVILKTSDSVMTRTTQRGQQVLATV